MNRPNRQQTSGNSDDRDYETEFQVALRERRINELLNEIEDLRKHIDPPSHVPFQFDQLIQAMRRETKSNEEEIRLLSQIVTSTGIPESELAVRKKLEDEIEKNKSYGRELGVENLQQLHAERALRKRENELLKEQEEEFKQSIEDMEKQKRKADEILKRYREKHGAIDPDSQPAES